MAEKPGSKLVRVQFGPQDIRSLSPADVKRLGLQGAVLDGGNVDEPASEPDAQPSGGSAAERRATRAAAAPVAEPVEDDEAHDSEPAKVLGGRGRK